MDDFDLEEEKAADLAVDRVVELLEFIGFSLCLSDLREETGNLDKVASSNGVRII